MTRFATLFVPLALAAVGACLSPKAHALDAATEMAERERIRTEREQVEATYRRRETDCRQRFVVTPCLEDARRDRRQANDRLRQQLEVLDEAQRKQRAAQRIDEIRSRISGEEAKRREEDAKRAQHQAQSKAPAPDAVSPSQAASAADEIVRAEPTGASVRRASKPRAASAADEAKHEADYERRQSEAQKHRESVERRNAQRAKSGKQPAKDLPVPDAASAAQ
jgi:hypothetical protein